MGLLVIDPGSRSVGWCFAGKDAFSPYRVKRAGKVVGPKGDLDVRTDKIVEKTEEVIKETNAAEALIEMPSGKVHLRHGGGGSGLAAYGWAAGAIWQLCRDRLGKDRVYVVKAEYWIGGHSKEKRRRVALKAFPGLEQIKDPGFDVSDAIALSVWWRERQ